MTNLPRELHLKFTKDVVGESTIKIMTRLQKAYWFYIDHCLPDKDPSMTFVKFVHLMSPFVRWQHKDVWKYIKQFRKHSSTVTRCGGLLLNSDRSKVLMVRGINSTKWTFPMGKMDIEETVLVCSRREVFEETGFDGRPDESRCLSFRKRGADYHLFLYANIPENYPFSPQTLGEIEEVKWFSLRDLKNTIDNKLFRAVSTFIANLDDQELAKFSPMPEWRRWFHESSSEKPSIEPLPLVASG